MKHTYISPVLTVQMLSDLDVIATSGLNGTFSSDGDCLSWDDGIWITPDP